MKFFDRFKRKNRPAAETATPASTPVPAPAEEKSIAPTSTPERPVDQPVNPDELRLELGDFLHRVPAHLLHPGPHDLKLEVFFSIQDLSQRIARGTTTINLAELYRQAPQIFRTEIKENDGHEIRFPWQKLAAMVNQVAPVKEDTSADSSANDIAERLRKKRREEETAARRKKSAPIIRGRSQDQASWFSKTTVERPAEAMKPPAPEPGALRGGGFGPADPFAPEIPFRLAQDDAARKSASDPQRKADERAIAKLPPDAQARIAVIRGEYERQLTDLELARKTYADEVDRLEGELSRLNSEREEFAAEYEKLRGELDALAAERDAARDLAQTLQKELHDMNEGSQLAALVAERDALLQQKAHLSAQITQLGKRGGMGYRAGDTSTTAVPQQRQVDELQRRIALMENSQRETALELTREKEARARAEKLLAAAEKVQEQSATYMESTKAGIRREIEASMKAREIETRRIQKELQEQLTTLSEQHRTVTAELERAREELAEATRGRESHPETIQAQAIQQLETDIENYRERLKILVRERDEARDELRRAFGAQGEENRGEALQAERSKLQDEISILQQQYVEHSAALEAIRERRTREEKSAQEPVSRTDDRSATLAQREEEERMALKRELARLQGERDNLQHERDSLLFQLSEKERPQSGGSNDGHSDQEHLSQGELLPPNVIEVSMPEVVGPDSGKNVHIARVRPVTIPPPKIG